METPNVVLITLDTTRRDRLSCYGYDKNTTPNIDEFVKEATLYEDPAAPSIWSLPSHASFFTGKYPHEHEATFISPFLDTDTPLAQQLSDAGYTTVGIAPNFVVRPSSGLETGFDIFQTPEVMQVPSPLIPLYQQYSEIASSSSMLRKTSESLWRLYRQFFQSKETPENERRRSTHTVEEAEAALQETNDPFFLFINVMDPHLPHHPEERFKAGFVDKDLETDAPHHPHLYNTGDHELTDENVKALNQLYDADICAMDNRVGRIFDELKRQGHWDNTLIILVGDHGEHLGENNLIGHEHSVDEEVINVPLIIKYPDQQEPKRVTEPVETRKIYHTILHETIDPQQDTLQNPDNRPVYGEYYPPMIDFHAAREEGELKYVNDAADNPVMFIRDRDHKIIFYRGNEYIRLRNGNEQDTKISQEDIRDQIIDHLPRKSLISRLSEEHPARLKTSHNYPSTVG